MKKIICYPFLLALVIGFATVESLFSKNAKNCITNKKNLAQKDTLFNVYLDDSLSSFSFKDTLDKDFRITEFKGKYVLVDLWYSGCGGCIKANEGLHHVHDKIQNENIVFLSISIDREKNKWLSSVRKDAVSTKQNPWAGKYHPALGTVCLYTAGSGFDNPFIRKFSPHNSYPQLILIDPSGYVISSKLPRPDFEPQKLIDYLMQIL